MIPTVSGRKMAIFKDPVEEVEDEDVAEESRDDGEEDEYV